MSNYTVTTNFLSKDALISGNPLKLVKGADLTVEFNNIAVACNSKGDQITGTFTATLTGIVGGPTATCTYAINGNMCTIITPPAFNGTSNLNTMTLTGLPSPCIPATISAIIPCNVVDNGANCVGAVQTAAAVATLTFYRSSVSGTVVNLLAAGFTATGVKGLANTSFTYPLL